MRLEVVIPTYNRSNLLPQCLQALMSAPVPANLEVRVTVVDNNSTDDTKAVVESWSKQHSGRIRYLFEQQQGRSAALNRGITATESDLVGFIDDDEEIDSEWYNSIAEAFADSQLDFIGGPYVPKWEVQPPAWLPQDHEGVIGLVDAGPNIIPYDENYPGILMGGNAVLRRSALEKAGLYATALGRRGDRLLAGEDEDMYRRLLASGATGRYLPHLKIYHLVPESRLTKKYYRQWAFWRGVSCGVLDRSRPQSVPYLLGIPRYLFGDAMRGLSGLMTAPLRTSGPAKTFSNQLAIWDLAGFFYGKHFYEKDSA